MLRILLPLLLLPMACSHNITPVKYQSGQLDGAILWNEMAISKDEATHRIMTTCATYGLRAKEISENKTNNDVRTEFVCVD